MMDLLNKDLLNKDFLKKYWLMIVVLVLFCAITIPIMLNHYPWYDEAHAWCLSDTMNFTNFTEILKCEGHFILWYLVLMPFAKFNFAYPYSMLCINWLFYFLAMIIMWKKAPFNNITKIIITFSWISICYFPIVARCYSLGILLLFITCSLYNKQLKKPILYSLAMVLTAHTTLMNAFAIVPLSIIYFYNLIKNRFQLKKQHIISVFILLIGAILWIAPFIKGYGPPGLLASQIVHPQNLLKLFSLNHYLLGFLFVITWGILFTFTNNKIKFWLLLVTAEFIFFHSFIYNVNPHLGIYLFVYLIVATWLTPKFYEINKKTIVFLVFFASILFMNQGYCFKYILETFDQREIANYLNKLPGKKFLYIYWGNYSDVLPYLKRDKYIAFGIHDNVPMSYESIKRYIELHNDMNNFEAITITNKKLSPDSIQFSDPKKRNKNFYYVTIFNINKGKN